MTLSPQICYFIYLGKNVQDHFASRGEGGIENLFLINNKLERPTACGCSLTPCGWEWCLALFLLVGLGCPVISGRSLYRGRG